VLVIKGVLSGRVEPNTQNPTPKGAPFYIASALMAFDNSGGKRPVKPLAAGPTPAGFARLARFCPGMRSWREIAIANHNPSIRSLRGLSATLP
jgi:hypothetical protein